LEEVLLLTTPVSKYEDIESWYKDFKRQMRKKIRDENTKKQEAD
jgi:ribosomal protein S21